MLISARVSKTLKNVFLQTCKKTQDFSKIKAILSKIPIFHTFVQIRDNFLVFRRLRILSLKFGESWSTRKRGTSACRPGPAGCPPLIVQCTEATQQEIRKAPKVRKHLAHHQSPSGPYPHVVWCWGKAGATWLGKVGLNLYRNLNHASPCPRGR